MAGLPGTGTIEGLFGIGTPAASSKLSDQQIAAVAGIAGLGGNSQVTAVAIALAESGGDATATHQNSNGSTDYGLWQINSVHGLNPKQLLDPGYNAQAMMSISHQGHSWSAWSTYNNGRYLAFMPRALLAVQDVIRGGGSANYLVNHPVPGQHAGNPFDTNFPGVNSAVGGLTGFLSKILSTGLWIRIVEIGGGLVLLILALLFGARSMGVA